MSANRKQTNKGKAVAQEDTEQSRCDQAVKYWTDFWPKLQDALLDSEEHFDKKVFALSAGAIGLELSILQFVKGTPVAVWCVVVSTSLCLAALILNLLVQYFAKNRQEKQAELIRDFIQRPKENDDYITERLIKDNNILKWINLISMVFLFGGIVFLGVFTFINLF